MNQLFYGDNLEVLKKLKNDSVDLIYLDPPFNSKRNYNIFFPTPDGSFNKAQTIAFSDFWKWDDYTAKVYDDFMQGEANTQIKDFLTALKSFLAESDMMSYLVNISARLDLLRKILKPKGTIFLHCDPTASHYIKLIMDNIFGVKNFRNEIIWCYRGGGVSKKDFAKKHDVIFRYSKTKDYFFDVDPVRIPYSEASAERLKNSKAKAFRGDKVYDSYKPNEKGKHPEDWWEIQPLSSSDPERTGYPTQKPRRLLRRVIKSSTQKGDTVLDPFAGCGTSIHVAEELGLNWIGIDITCLSINIIKNNIENAFPKCDFKVRGLPKTKRDLDNMLNEAKEIGSDKWYEFQHWVVNNIPGAQDYVRKSDGSIKKGADGGIDGLIYIKTFDSKDDYKKILISVKGGKNIGVKEVREFNRTVQKNNALGGIFVSTREPTKEMTKEALSVGMYKINNKRFNKMLLVNSFDFLDKKFNLDIPQSNIDPTSSIPRSRDDSEKQLDFGLIQ